MPIRPCVPPGALVALLFWLAGAGGVAVGQTEPEIGKPGKDVMWVPTPSVLVDKMLEMAGVTSADVVIDLGSGDGRTVIAAARRGARAIGIEFDPELVELSRARAVAAGVSDQTRFVAGDLFEADLSAATVVTLFLTPDLNLKLRPRLAELRPGTRIVSNTWDLGEWQADETVVLDPCPGFCTALLWIVPARVSGTWRLSDGSRLRLEQRFQSVTGSLDASGTTVPVGEGRLRGEQLSFRAGGTRYTGRVNGDVIHGTSDAVGRTLEWTATRITSADAGGRHVTVTSAKAPAPSSNVTCVAPVTVLV